MKATVTYVPQEQIQRFRELQGIPYRLKIPYAIGKAQEFFNELVGVRWENEYIEPPKQLALFG